MREMPYASGRSPHCMHRPPGRYDALADLSHVWLVSATEAARHRSFPMIRYRPNLQTIRQLGL
jgi:hypothetical protein